MSDEGIAGSWISGLELSQPAAGQWTVVKSTEKNSLWHTHKHTQTQSTTGEIAVDTREPESG